jgi:citrate lyase beta subunit
MTVLRRALLYVPGADPRKIAASFKCKPDCRIFDLEDSVTADQKVGVWVQFISIVKLLKSRLTQDALFWKL